MKQDRSDTVLIQDNTTQTSAELPMSTPPDDRQLMRQFAATCDRHSYEKIVAIHTPCVLATARKVLGDHDAAQDVAQETFVRLLQTDHPPSRSLAGWLGKVSLQIAIDKHRSEKARHRREAVYGRDLCQRRLTAKSNYSWREIGALVQETIRDLPAGSRDLIEQHYLHLQTLRDMAQQRGVSPATMHRQVHAAVQMLRTRLSRKGVLMPAAALSSLLAVNLAYAAALGAAAAVVGGSSLFALKVTSTLCAAVIVASVTSRINFPASPLNDLPLPGQRSVMAETTWQQLDFALALLINHQGSYFYVPAGTQSRTQGIMLFHRPDSQEENLNMVILGDLSIVDMTTRELSEQLQKQVGQSLEQYTRASR
jgi:RNA polymerase sigma factor (sigma-70 family)